MFSCCACTRPSKLDTEEARSDDTSDSDEEDSSLEDDENSEDGDAKNSEDEKPKEMEETLEKETAEKVETEVHTEESPIFEKGTPHKSSSSTEVLSQKSSTSTEISSQKISTSTEVLSQKTSVEEEAPSPSKIEDSPVLQKSPLEKEGSPDKIQTQEEKDVSSTENEVPDSGLLEKGASPEKIGSFEDESPESKSNTGSVLNLSDFVIPPPDSKIEGQILTREKSQSFEDEEPSPESSSNTGSVVHLPATIINEVTSLEKISILKNEVPSPENFASSPKSGSFEVDDHSPENTSTTGSVIQLPSIIIDNEVPSPPRSLSPENVLIPPPESGDFNLPSENGDIIPPPESQDFGSGPESGSFIPPPELGDIISPPESGDFMPPPQIEDILPPELGDITSPHESGDFMPPPQIEDLSPPEIVDIISPEIGDIIAPPDSEDFGLSAESESFIPPPESVGFTFALESGDFIPPPESEDFGSVLESGSFFPPSENEVLPSSTDNGGLSPQKSPTFDSEIPSPQNTWISSSADEERRKIDITEFIGIVGNVKRKKSPLHHAPAYIERTVDDGPEEEGDDSVFESYPTPPPPEIDANACKKETVPPPIPRWLSQEDEDENISEGYGGMQEPPATPVARDELALRRHRFFSDLLQATKNSAEHKVSFDPLGPTVHPGCEADDREEHLEELVTRLENVTRRLERVPIQGTPETQEIAVQTKTPSPEKSPSPKKSAKESISSEDQCSLGSTTSISSTASSIVEINNMAVAGFEDIVAGPVREYLDLSRKIGGDVASHSQLVEKAFQIQLGFIRTASSRPAPANQNEQVSLLGPTSTQIQQIQEFRDKHRASPFFNHLSAISESIPALGWVAVAPTPAPYIKEMNDAGQFYTNRVLKDWKEKDKRHVEWCKSWVQTLTDLQQYVRKNHTTGLVWAKGGSVPPPPACGLPPPAPPSMPIGDVEAVENDDRSALFAEINQGENITRNLKKVTSEMQTHKNPNLRTGPAPFKAPATGSPVKNTLPANAPIDKPPVFTRDGKKWLVEYHKGNKNLLVENAEMNNVIYMYRCQDSTLVIKGKVNSVVIDSCRKSSIVFDSLVSSIEFVNCQSCQMQVLGKVPTISVDKTDGCQMYLSPESLEVEIISSKSSEMNVMVPKGNGDYTEFPVPEQFKTTVSPKGLSTIAVDSLG